MDLCLLSNHIRNNYKSTDQFDISHKPVDDVDSASEGGGKGLPLLPAAGVYKSCCG
jgi:hypothetical protein